MQRRMSQAAAPGRRLSIATITGGGGVGGNLNRDNVAEQRKAAVERRRSMAGGRQQAARRASTPRSSTSTSRRSGSGPGRGSGPSGVKHRKRRAASVWPRTCAWPPPMDLHCTRRTHVRDALQLLARQLQYRPSNFFGQGSTLADGCSVPVCHGGCEKTNVEPPAPPRTGGRAAAARGDRAARARARAIAQARRRSARRRSARRTARR